MLYSLDARSARDAFQLLRCEQEFAGIRMNLEF
jgi:hypothetical protein